MLGKIVKTTKDTIAKGTELATKHATELTKEVTKEPEPPLKILEDTENMMMEQKMELLESAIGIAASAVGLGPAGVLGETANQYSVYGADGTRQFKIVETSEKCGGFDDTWVCCCTGRNCCAPNHKLQLHFYRPGYFSKKEILFLDRPFKGPGCCCACCECCLQEATIYVADDDGTLVKDDEHKLGHIKQPTLGGLFTPQLNVMDRDAQEIATVNGPTCCVGGFCCDSIFTVSSKDGKELAQIANKRPSDDATWARELLTDADRYTINFPKDTDVKSKALMLSTMVFLDYLFFEGNTNFACDITKCSCSLKCCDIYCCGCLCPCSCTCAPCQEESN